MKYVVIGGCASGMSFAARLKRNQPDAEIIILEKNNYVSFGACALPYFLGDNFKEENKFFARTPEQTIASGLDLKINAEVTNVNFDNKEVTYVLDGQEVVTNYDKLVITSGAKPIVPNFVEGSRENVLTLTTFNDGVIARNKLKDDKVKKIAVIGAGFIGIEIMDNAHLIGKEVTVFEREDAILKAQFSMDMSEVVKTAVLEHGVDLRLSTSVEKVEGTENGVLVTSNGKTEEFDICFISLGFRPNTSFVDGLNKLPNGAIIVNEKGETSVNDVYSVGDCATVKNSITGQDEYIPLATVANKFGKALADFIVGIDNPFEGLMGSSCIKVFDYEMGRTGLSLQKALEFFPNATKSLVKDKNRPDYLPNQQDIYIKLVYDKVTHKIYGGEVVGKVDAVMRTNVIATMISLGGTTKQLGYIDFCYAPPFSRTWDALNLIGNVIK